MLPPAPGTPGDPVIIVGAGIGGLATAIRLRAAGVKVVVLERAPLPGGKVREIEVGGLRFDAGPTVLTMPWVFEDLFQAAGARLSDWLTLRPLLPACRHFFPDGVVLDLYNDEPGDRTDGAGGWERSAVEIERVLGRRSREQFERFRRHARSIYRAVQRPFLQRALPATPFGLLVTHEFRDAWALLRVDSGRTMWRALSEFFDDEHLRVLFARYATYSGADPFRAPATLNVIPHVELGMGVFSIAGGMYRLAEALAGLARRLGVDLRCGAEVERIELCQKERRALAVHAGGERLPAAAVVANCDVPHLFARLLHGTRLGQRQAQRLAGQEASLSAHVRLVVARAEGAPELAHHDVFFSPDYRREFEELSKGRTPALPTIYLCAPDAAQGRRDAAQRWFFLINAPPLPGPGPGPEDDPTAEGPLCAALRPHGIELSRHVLHERAVTPADFAALFPESRGALYGGAPNSRMSAFRRPPNAVRGVENLYCVGGSTHPGAGLPMVTLSAQITAQLCRKGLRDR